MKIELRKVTPKMAEAWLKKNPISNRALRQDIVAGLVSDIESGNWVVTHQGICFDGAGNLIDGQHRLTAIVQSGKSVEILVAENATADISDPIDRNRPRSMNYLTGYATKAIAAFRVIRGLEHGRPYAPPMTPAETRMVFERHSENYGVLKSDGGLDKVVGGALAMLIWAIPINDRVAEFAQQMARGEMIKRGDPAFALRNWLQGNKNAFQPWDTAMATANCIAHFLSDKSMRSVYSTTSGYRWITTRRRLMKLPHTPNAELVPSVNNLKTEEE